MNSLHNTLRRWRMRRILRRDAIPRNVWQDATRHMALLERLDAVQLAHLRELATWFLHAKAVNGVQGLDVTPAMRVTVAAQACLLILNLDIDYFDNWAEVILYPGAFRVSHEQRDAYGLVHSETRDLTGESWLHGPVILSWDDVQRDCDELQPGRNVVLHEFAHKLDGRNGANNGMPPLRRGMSRERWAADFSAAYHALCAQLEADESTLIDPYAATSPAEFFAVTTEYFFTAPQVLKYCSPSVYRQLERFYSQPAVR